MEEIAELIKAGKNELVEQKLRENPSLANVKTEHGISLLQFSAYCRNRTAIDIIKKYKNQFDIYETACIGDVEALNLLLEKNPKLLNSFSADGFTILGLASFLGHIALVEFLLNKGVDPNIASNNQFKVAPLHSACATSNIDIAYLLIKHGANVNAKQMQGVTPLHSAAHNGQSELVKLLVDNGADINAKMDTGKTPLGLAKEKNFHETADLIVQLGGH